MKNISPNELSYLLSQYVDGELEEHEKNAVEAYLQEHPEAVREVEQLRTLKQKLSSTSLVEPNPWFYSKLSHAIEEKFTKKQFIFLRQPVIAFSTMTIVLVMVVGVSFIGEKNLFLQFFDAKKEQVENLQNSFMKGSIIPLFSDITKEKVLEFMLFGSLPIDSTKTTTLQVHNDNATGAKVELVKNSPSQKKSVSVKDFYATLAFTPQQKIVIDSILDEGKQKIQTSVLVGENDAIAVNAEIGKLNQVMLVNVASQLTDMQRTRFQKLLQQCNAPYRIEENIPLQRTKKVFAQNLKNHKNKFVVITSDSVNIAELPEMNFDIMMERKHHNGWMKAQKVMREFQRREIKNYSFAEKNVRIANADGGGISIHIENEIPNMIDMVIAQTVIPKSQMREKQRIVSRKIEILQDSSFAFEINTNDEVAKFLQSVPHGEFNVEMFEQSSNSPRVRFYMRTPKNSQRNFSKQQRMREQNIENEKRIDIDSLLQQSEKRSKQKNGSVIEL